MRTVTSKAMPSFLIVNADDFGYFRCVSQGIVQAHVLGIVTATGVFGNSPNLNEDALLLFEHPNLDAGVHLNLTFGNPLTEGVLRNAPQLKGRFPSKLELVWLLITNAIEAMDGAGTLSISAGVRGRWHEIKIADNGPGIPEHLQKDLFVPFGITTKGGGSGLGLAIAQELAKAHKGNILLEKSDLHGTVFSITLPIYKA